jgi:glycine cleavage system H lipoate-binding protein
MLYSRDHVWIDATDPGRARIGITSFFGGVRNPVPIPAPVDFTIIIFRDDIPLHDLRDDPEGAGYIAVVSCTDISQLAGLMSASEYADFCEGVDEVWNATNNPVRFPPDPYTAGQTFATVEGA